jgi:hypothetical protein
MQSVNLSLSFLSFDSRGCCLWNNGNVRLEVANYNIVQLGICLDSTMPYLPWLHIPMQLPLAHPWLHIHCMHTCVFKVGAG